MAQLEERAALRLSAVGALILGTVALVATIASGSQAILLDALFSYAFFATALFTLRVVDLLERPDDRRFPHGYAYFEPITNLVKGLLLLGVSVFAFVTSIGAILSGGRDLALGPAMIYGVVSTLSCTAVWAILRRSRDATGSPLLAADTANWLVDAALSAGILAAFAGAAWLSASEMEAAARYVDPGVVAVIVLLSISMPVRLVRGALNELLARAPPEEVTAPIEAAVREVLAPLPTRQIYVRTLRPGRTTDVLVHVLVAQDAPITLAAADAYRERIVTRLTPDWEPLIFDAVFTTLEDHAQPSRAFTVADSAP